MCGVRCISIITLQCEFFCGVIRREGGLKFSRFCVTIKQLSKTPNFDIVFGDNMKFCPMCGMTQSDARLTVCEFCSYEEKGIEELSKQEFCDLMAPYDYDIIEDGVRINAVKNNRDTAMRGAVAIPHFVTEIGANAFSHCKFLSRIELPRELRSIGAFAFAHCRDLFDVFIPKGVSFIGRGAFADCYDLSVISAAAPMKPEDWDAEWLSNTAARVEWACKD